MQKENTIHKYQTKDFYEKSIPEVLRSIISKDIFYSNLQAIAIEIRKSFSTTLNISIKTSNLLYARFQEDLTFKEINDQYDVINFGNNELDKIANIIHSYFEIEVIKYPIRAFIFAQPNLRNKHDLRSSIINFTTVITFLKAYIDGKYDKAINEGLGRKRYQSMFSKMLSNGDKSYHVSNRTKVYLNQMAINIITSLNDAEIRNYVLTNDRTKNQTIENILNEIKEMDGK